MVLTKCDRCGKQISKDGAVSWEDLEQTQQIIEDIWNGKKSLKYSRSEINTKGWAMQFDTRFDLCDECTNDFVNWLWDYKKEEQDAARV